MPARAVNIAQVAAEAGVGVGTVSRVLNGSTQVRPETRARVMEVMGRLGYRPSHAAASLSLGASRSVAVLVPFLTRPSVVARLAGVLRVLDAEGFDALVLNIESADQRDRALASLTARHRADGIVVISVPLERSHLAAVTAQGMPVVLVDSDRPGVPRYVVDDVAGGRLATEHLVSLGHRRIAFVGDEVDGSLGFSSSDRRRRGYEQALVASGLAADDTLVATGHHDANEATRLAAKLLRAPGAPTAVFAASDTQAFGVLHAAEELGIGVPTEVSVIGFDDVDFAELVGLSTVRQPLSESGALAAGHLCRLMRGEPARRVRRILPLELVKRASTGAPGRRAPPF